MVIHGQNGVTLNSGVHSVADVQSLHDHFSCANDYSLKARKPYTITKQRERWTDEEHNKFLEALKLYGRAWRKIEEHVGTKTAVQIRSHAQKFFSKIIRDTDGNTTTLVESIEIPPPRPKRKPSHPYPRKIVEIPKNAISILDQSLRSNSLRSLDFGQENKSPKSVLSEAVSETLVSSDSDTLTGSLSPVSSVSVVHTSSFPLFETKSSSEEDVSTKPDEQNVGSNHNKTQPLVKLELICKESVSNKEDASEELLSRTLKLFGATLLLTDTCSSEEPSKPIPQFQNGCSDIATIVPWWTFMPIHKEPGEKKLHSNHGEFEDKKEVQNEESCGGSNTSSINDGENNEGSNDQAKSDHHEHYLVGQTRQSEIMRLKTTFGKGFVPYKRCMSEREVTDEERAGQRIRLYL